MPVADVGAGGGLNFHRVYAQLLPASFHTSLLISSCPNEVRTAGIFNIRPSLTQHNPSCQSLCKMVCFQTCTSLATKKKAPGICRSFNCRGVSQDETFGIQVPQYDVDLGSKLDVTRNSFRFCSHLSARQEGIHLQPLQCLKAVRTAQMFQGSPIPLSFSYTSVVCLSRIPPAPVPTAKSS